MQELISAVGLPELLALGSSFTYSVTFISLRQGLRSGSPLTGVIIMAGIVAAFTLTAALIQGTLQTSNPVALLWFALAGCVGQCLGQLASFTGIQRMGVSRAAPIQGSSPIWSVILAVIILGERPGLPVWLGASAVVVGVAFLSRRGNEQGGTAWDWLRGALVFPLVASVLFAFMPVVAKFGFAYQRTPMVGIGTAFGAATVLLLAARFGLGIGGRLQADRSALRWFALAGVCTTASAVLFWTALSMGEVSIVMPLSRIGPLWAVIWTVLFLGNVENVNARVFFAAVLIIAGGGTIMAFK